MTRNKDSPKALALAEKYKGLLTLYTVDHNDPKSMEEAFEDANALYLNGAMSKDESLVYEKILEAALQAKRNGASLNHIIYSSSVECHRDHGVPHWETSRRTEEYLRNLQTTDECSDLTVHFVRFAHCNENLLNYFAPSKSGWMAFPWDVSVRTPTASVKDGARVTCRLFLDPKLMNNGESVDIVTDFASPSDMAAEVSRVQGRKVQAYKGPWILLHVVNHLFWEPKTIVIMGKFLETNDLSNGFVSEPDKIRVLLKDEINNGEPLESVAAFCERSFSKFE